MNSDISPQTSALFPLTSSFLHHPSDIILQPYSSHTLAIL